jgi:hypothetical protein
MSTETKTSRIHRTWFDKLSLWKRAYETQISDGRHEAIGRGPTAEASQTAAGRNWVAKQAAEQEPRD